MNTPAHRADGRVELHGTRACRKNRHAVCTRTHAVWCPKHHPITYAKLGAKHRADR